MTTEQDIALVQIAREARALANGSEGFAPLIDAAPDTEIGEYVPEFEIAEFLVNMAEGFEDATAYLHLKRFRDAALSWGAGLQAAGDVLTQCEISTRPEFAGLVAKAADLATRAEIALR